MLKTFVGVRDVTAADADAAAAPPRIRPTTLDTNESDGTEMLAHIFMRVPMVEFTESLVVDLVRGPRVRKKGDDEEEQGGTARAAVERRYPCCWYCWMPTIGDIEVVATLPNAVTGAISVSSNSWVVQGYFVMIEIFYWLSDQSRSVFFPIFLILNSSRFSFKYM